MYHYVFRTPAGNRKIQLESDPNFDKYDLSGVDAGIRGDVLYVLPGTLVPMEDIREYCKSRNSKVTTDLSKATKILGNARTKVKLTDAEQVRNYHYLIEFIEPNLNSQVAIPTYYSNPAQEKEEYNKRLAMAKEWYDTAVGEVSPGPKDIIFHSNTVRRTSSYRHSGYYALYNCFKKDTPSLKLVSPELAKIVNSGLPIVSDQVISNGLSKATVLDKDSLEMLVKMFSSNDVTNHKVAAEILCNCDVSKSLYWIWKLSKGIPPWRLSNYSSLKRVRLLIAQCDWYNLPGYSAHQLITELHKRGALDTAGFELLSDEVLEEFKKVLPPVFKYSITPAPEYWAYSSKTYNL